MLISRVGDYPHESHFVAMQHEYNSIRIACSNCTLAKDFPFRGSHEGELKEFPCKSALIREINGGGRVFPVLPLLHSIVEYVWVFGYHASTPKKRNSI